MPHTALCISGIKFYGITVPELCLEWQCPKGASKMLLLRDQASCLYTLPSRSPSSLTLAAAKKERLCCAQRRNDAGFRYHVRHLLNNSPAYAAREILGEGIQDVAPDGSMDADASAEIAAVHVGTRHTGLGLSRQLR